ncbi:hypothetical protein IE996_30510 [Klebsiella pneumoniae]|uniref:Uncharacterized protein n=1 Tax=Klebsiella pneumoniae TaxID=573 RepID=A0A927HQH8_KLEPN|nr:hypothetical protein [Klebsiella pneumoniae]
MKNNKKSTHALALCAGVDVNASPAEQPGQTPSEMIPNTTIFNRMHFSLLNERENSSFSSLSAYSINQRE